MSAQPNSRRLVCEFVIGAAICGAAYYFLVDSAKGKLAATREKIAAAQAKDAAVSGVGGLTDAQVRDLQRVTAERVAEIKMRSAPATDEAAMFAELSDLAAGHNVRVEQVNPVASASAPAPVLPPGVSSGTPAAAEAMQQAAAAPKDAKTAYTMSVSGRYSDLAAFLGSLSGKLGYTLIRTVRIGQPDSQASDMLRAEIASDHFGFDVTAIKLPPVTPTTTQPMPVSPQAAANEQAP